MNTTRPKWYWAMQHEDTQTEEEKGARQSGTQEEDVQESEEDDRDDSDSELDIIRYERLKYIPCPPPNPYKGQKGPGSQLYYTPCDLI